MILSSHAIIGAAIAANLFPTHPVIGFVAAFASHFIADAIPHWEYRLASYKKDPNDPLKNTFTLNRAFVRDLAWISGDLILGIAISFWLFNTSTSLLGLITAAWVWGVVGGVAPDFLQFVYSQCRREPLISLQRLHLWIHSKKELDKHPILGILFQVVCVVTIVGLIIWAS